MSTRESLASRYLGGRWVADFDALLAEAPGLLEAYLRLAALPWRGRGLSTGLKELVCVALSSSPGHLYPPGIRMHVAGALRAGVPRAYVLRAAVIASGVAVHGPAAVLALLAEAKPAPAAASGRVVELREGYRRRHQHWSPALEALVTSDPELFEAYAGVLDEADGIPPRDRELIALAVNSAHRNPEPAGAHLRAALDLGATADQVIEVLRLASSVGIHGCLLVADELLAAGEPAAAPDGRPALDGRAAADGRATGAGRVSHVPGEGVR